MRRGRLLAPVAFFFFTMDVSGWCQRPDLTEKSLEELMSITVTTASKHEQLASEAPASVIGRDDRVPQSG